MTSPIHTKIWHELPEDDNPFATKQALCHGYDVYGNMVGHSSWSEMTYLLFRGERPTDQHAAAFDVLAVALANPGPRDPAIHAAMCGGIGGSVAASSLMAALAVGAGQSGGARDLYLTMQDFVQADADTAEWEQLVTNRPMIDSTWPAIEHVPGFDPNGVTTTLPVVQTLHAACVALDNSGKFSTWLLTNRSQLEAIAGHPLSLIAVIAATLLDLGFTSAQGEMLHLILRLPGAAVHAIEQEAYGFKKFPFPPIDLKEKL